MSLKKVFPLKINGKTVCLTYEGCDVLKLGSPISFKLPTLPIASNVAYIRIESSHKLFFVNKTENRLTPVKCTQEQIDQFDTVIGLPQLQIDGSKSLTEANLENIKHILQHNAPGSKKIRDVEFTLNQEERERVLKKLFDKKVTSKNAAYTYIFQAHLAKYQGKIQHEIDLLQEQLQNTTKQTEKDHVNAEIKHIENANQWMNHLHSLSTEFIDFEYFINNPYHNNTQFDPEKTLSDLLEVFEKHKKNIQNKLQNISKKIKHTNYANKPEIAVLLENLEINLIAKISTFITQIETLQYQGPTKDEIQCLVSMQTRSMKIHALGSFMAEQMLEILNAGIKISYKISDARFKDLFEMPDNIVTLSDAKKMIYLKSQTLDGAEYNDTYSPIPKKMLNTLTGRSIDTTKPPEEFSLKPYLANWNPIDLDEAVCLVTGTPLHHKVTAPVYIAIISFAASIAELFIIAPIRFITTITGTIIDLTGSILQPILGSVLDPLWRFLRGRPFFATSPEDKITNQIERLLSKIHKRISPVIAAKNWWNDRYQRKTGLQPTPKELESTKTHQELLDECKESSNFYHEIFEYLNPERISSYIKSFVSSIVLSPVKLYQDLIYTFSLKNTEEIYQRVQARYQLTKYLREKLEDDQKYKNYQKAEIEPYYCPINEISSPLEVFREIMLTLDDTIVDAMFRKSPGFATFYFIISATTFGTYLAPASALAIFKSFPALLKIPTDVISLHFTGKSTALGIQEQMVACFLEWKLGFFTTEFLLEAKRGKFDFLNEIIKEPEQVTMGLIGLIGLGMSLRYIPLLPTTITIPSTLGLPSITIYNYYAEIVNVFIDEAISCKQGTFILTSLEYGFLGLKFAMLMHSMLSGAHQSEYSNALQRLAKACSEKEFFKKLIQQCKNDETYQKLDAKDKISYFRDNILKPTLDKILEEQDLTNEFSAQELNVFYATLANQIPIALDNYKQYKKQNFEEHASLQNKIKNINSEKRMQEILRQKIKIHLCAPPTQLNLSHDTLFYWYDNQLVKIENGIPENIAISNLAYFQTSLNSLGARKTNSIEIQTVRLNELINYQSPLQVAHAKLKNAIEMINDKKNPIFINDPSQIFSRLKEANKFYDHLDKLFNNYNYELQRSGNADLCINKQDFLDVFYNKYCYQGSNNFLRSLLFFPPFYMMTVLIRETKRFFAQYLDRPSTIQQLQKSYNKDLVLLLQFVAIGARTYYAMGRALSYALRTFFILAAAPITLLFAAPYLLYIRDYKPWYKAIDRIASSISFHHTPPLYYLKTAYAQSARLAGSNEKINDAGNAILGQLNGAKDVLTHFKLISRRHLTQEIKGNPAAVLARYDKAIKKENSPAKKSISESVKTYTKNQIIEEFTSQNYSLFMTTDAEQVTKVFETVSKKC